MASTVTAAAIIPERIELAKFCSSKDWSKAIRILDSLLSQSSPSVLHAQDFCNRAFCYSQLELYKHVVKDCDKALQLDSTALQAYILKGRAFSTLGRQEDALLVWEQGYACAVRQCSDLKHLLELDELVLFGKQSKAINAEKLTTDIMSSGSPTHVSESGSPNQSGEALTYHNDICEESHSWTWSSSKSEICDNSGENSDICNDISDKVKGNDQLNFQSNGVYTNLNKLTKLSDDSKSLNDLSDKIESCSKLPVKCGESSDKYEITANSINQPIILRPVLNGEMKITKKYRAAKLSQTTSIKVDLRVSRAIGQVNEGKYDQAILIFDKILKENPNYPEALIGRGTAHAFQRKLDAAIADFTMAIKANPSAGEAWKRRGQARAALGEPVQAIVDLTKALEYEPDSTDIFHERGIIHFKFKNFDAAVKDLAACVKYDKDNKSAHTYLGLALSSVGEHRKAEEAHLRSIQIDCNFVEARTHLAQMYKDLANPSKALKCLQEALQIDSGFAKAYHLRGLLFHGMGEHRKAIEDFSHALSFEKSNIESFYFRGSCHHAIGEYVQAVKDYDAALDLELDSVDKFVLQCLSFYQKEIALYTASRISSEFSCFNIDEDIDPLFKEYWCKRLHPKNVCEKVYRQPPLRKSQKKGKLKKQDFILTKQKNALLQTADSVGNKIQYTCQGFLPNKRQHRMAGLAAIEIAQKVSKVWRSLQAELKHSIKGTSKPGKKARRKERFNMLSQNRGGDGCSTSSSLETSSSYIIAENGPSARPLMSWRDVYSIAVKWRQISEPCDAVVWINKLSEEYNSGYGSSTPLILGQAKVVRYSSNFDRVLDIAKNLMKQRMYVRNKEDALINLSNDKKLEDIMKSKSCSELYRVVGEDFWLSTYCNSTASLGRQLEGTRITLLKTKDHGYDFSIRTPCTPSRWDEFDAEMTMAWDNLCNAYSGDTYGSTDFKELENIRDAILRMTYYWYNFMPLSRGSAAVGFVVLLGLLLAANMEFTGSIPQGVQVDWEAILNFDSNSFMESVKSWLYPSLNVSTSWKDYPDVAAVFPTTGSVVVALSSYEDSTTALSK